MAQRINPNILKLKTSKGMFNNSHYKNLSKNKNLLLKYQEDTFIQKYIEGFYFIFNFYTSEILINRQQSNLNINFLIFINDTNENINKKTLYNLENQNFIFNKNLIENPLNYRVVEKKIFKKSNYISKYNTIDFLYFNEIKQKY